MSSQELRGIGAAGTLVDGEIKAACGDVEEDVVEMEDMFCKTPVGLEWGGKMRGAFESRATLDNSL